MTNKELAKKEQIRELDFASEQMTYKIKRLQESLNMLPSAYSYAANEKKKRNQSLCKSALYFIKGLNLEKDVLVLPTGQRIRLCKLNFVNNQELKDTDSSWNGVNFKVINTDSRVTVQYSFDSMRYLKDGKPSIINTEVAYDFNPSLLIGHGMIDFLRDYTSREIEAMAIYGISPSKKELETAAERAKIESSIKSSKQILSDLRKCAAYERNRDSLLKLAGLSSSLNSEKLKKSVDNLQWSINLYSK